jgi:RHS repeat-associated protein
MRRFSHSWDTLRTKLGFRKVKARRSAKRHRQSRIEPLEIRAYLSGDPITTLDDNVGEGPVMAYAAFHSQPTYVLTNITPRSEDEVKETERLRELGLEDLLTSADLFLVATVQTSNGPRAVVSLNPAIADRVPAGLQTLKLELQLDGKVLEAYEILVDIAEESFRTQFLNDRIKAVRQKTPALSSEGQAERLLQLTSQDQRVAQGRALVGFIGPLTLQQEAARESYDRSLEAKEVPIDLSQKSTSELLALAAHVNREADLVGTQPELKSERISLYTETENRIHQASQLRQAAVSASEKQVAAEAEKPLQGLGLLLAKDLALDLASEDAAVKAAAERLRDELVAIGDVYHTAFAGLGVDHEVHRAVTSQGDLMAYALVESGYYAFDEHVVVDLDGQPAMVQVTKLNPYPFSSLVTVKDSPAVEDGLISSGTPTTPDPTGSSLAVISLGSGFAESLIRFNLSSTVSGGPVLANQIDLKLIESAVISGEVDVLAWKSLLPGETGSASDWDQTNLTWDRIYSTLDLDSKLDEFELVDTWEVGSTTSLDFSTQVRRALLYGDANGNGIFDPGGMAGDIEAFHLAVVDWEAYVEEYGPRVHSLSDLLARTDGGLGDGSIKTDDVSDFLRRFGRSAGDFNLNGTVDGTDWSIYQSSYDTSKIPLPNARFGQGDANFDGIVNAADFPIFDAEDGSTGLTPITPELMLWLRPVGTTSGVVFASQEHSTLASPTLEIANIPDLVINDFTVSGTTLRVDYSVLGGTFGGVQVQLFKEGSSTPLYTSSTQSGALGSRSLTIAASALSSIVEGDVVYAKVTPTSGTQSNTANDRLNFEFSTGANQIVNSLDDAGMDNLLRSKHTLRELIEANNVLGWFDTITFDPELFEDGAKRIVLGDHNSNGVADRLELKRNIAIQGPGAHLLTISGNKQVQVFNNAAGVTSSLVNLAIRDGAANSSATGVSNSGHMTLDGVVIADNRSWSYGGGVYSGTGSLTVRNSAIMDNFSDHGGGIYISPAGGHVLLVENSTIANNSANLGGGMEWWGSATASQNGPSTIINTTISGNWALYSGGMRLVYPTDVTLVNSTVTNNRARSVTGTLQQGGGFSVINGAKLTAHNSIIAGNFGLAASNDGEGALKAGSSYNLLGRINNGSHGASGAGNKVVTPGGYLGLAPLNDYGGRTMTHLVRHDSPAVDAGSDAVANLYGITKDQLGFTRFFDLVGVNDASGNLTDIGAYEDPPGVEVTEKEDVGVDGKLTLRAAINRARDQYLHGTVEYPASTPQIITFDDTFSNASHELVLQDQPMSDGDLVPDKLLLDFPVTIVGPGADLLTIDANGAPCAFEIPLHGQLLLQHEVTIGQLGITGAALAGIKSDGFLNVGGARIFDNQGSGLALGLEGALESAKVIANISQSTISGNNRGIANYLSALYLSDSTISGNHTAGNGGGIYNLEGRVFIERSTISGNSAASGGGISNEAWLGYTYNYEGAGISIANSTISGNSASQRGGGIFNLDLLYDHPHGYHHGPYYGPSFYWSTSEVEIENSTISGNYTTEPSSSGGGVSMHGGLLHLASSTVTGNRSATGGGIYAYDLATMYGSYYTLYGPLSAVSMQSSIIAGNTLRDQSTPSDIEGPLEVDEVLSTHNLIGHAATAGGLDHDVLHNIVGIAGAGVLDPKLAPLGDYGGPTKTHASLPGSPAIDKGYLTALPHDQRGAGFARVINGTRDIGAVEAHVTIDTGTGNVEIWGSEGNDVINLRPDGVLIDTVGGILLPLDFTSLGGGVSITVHALGGDDVVSASAAFPRGVVVYGGDGNDQIHGTAHDDELYGGAGADVIFAGAGDDEVYGGDGGDVLYGEAGADELNGEGGYDEAREADGADTVALGEGQTPAFNINPLSNYFAYLGSPTWKWTPTSTTTFIPKGGHLEVRYVPHLPEKFQLVDPSNGRLRVMVTDTSGNEITTGVVITEQTIKITPPENTSTPSAFHDYRIAVLDESDPLNPQLLAEGDLTIEQAGEGVPANEPPEFVTVSPLTVRSDQSIAVRVQANDPNQSSDSLSYEIISVSRDDDPYLSYGYEIAFGGVLGAQHSQLFPNVLVIDATQAHLLLDGYQGSPTTEFDILVRVTDSLGLYDEQTITVTVENLNLDAPQSTSWEHYDTLVFDSDGDLVNPRTVFFHVDGNWFDLSTTPGTSPPAAATGPDSQTLHSNIEYVFLDLLPPDVTDLGNGWLKWDFNDDTTPGVWAVRVKHIDDGAYSANSGDERENVSMMYLSLGTSREISVGFEELANVVAVHHFIDLELGGGGLDYKAGHGGAGTIDIASLPGDPLYDSFPSPLYDGTTGDAITFALEGGGPSYADQFAFDIEDGTFDYTAQQPEVGVSLGGEGLDSFKYRINAAAKNVSGAPQFNYLATSSNVATMSIEVGQMARPDIDLAGETSDASGSPEVSMWHTVPLDDEDLDGLGDLKPFQIPFNGDDDDDNGVPDYLDQNASSDDDLVPFDLSYWLRGDIDAEYVTASLNIPYNPDYGIPYHAFRFWDSPTKDNEIFPNATIWKLEDAPSKLYVENVLHPSQWNSNPLSWAIDLAFTLSIPGSSSFTPSQYDNQPRLHSNHEIWSDTVRLIPSSPGISLEVKYDTNTPTCSCSCTCTTSPQQQVSQDASEPAITSPAGQGLSGTYNNPTKSQPEIVASFVEADIAAAQGDELELFLVSHDGPSGPAIKPVIGSRPVTMPYDPDPGVVYTTQPEIDLFSVESGYYQYHLRPSEGGVNTPTLDKFHANHWLPVVKHGDYGFGDGWNIAGLERIIARPDDPAASTIYWLRADNEILEFPTIGVAAEHDRNATVIELDSVSEGFVLTDKYQQKTYFDSQGWITKRVDPYGNETIYSYTTGHKVSSVETTIDGHETLFHWDSGFDRVEKIEDFAGRVTLLHHDDVEFPNRLTRIELPDPDIISPALEGGGPVNHFAYDEDGRIASFTDADDVTTSYEYLYGGQVIRTTYALGTALEATTTQVSTETGSLSDAFASIGFPRQQLVDEFNTPNRTGSYTDELGRFTTFQTNSDGYIIKTTDPTGASTVYDRNSVGQPLKVRSYDAEGNLVDQVQYTYDSSFNRSSISYFDVTGSAPMAIASEHFAFDTYSRPTSYVDELGREVSITYTDFSGKPGAAEIITTRIIIGQNDTLSSELDDLVSHQTFASDGLLSYTTTLRVDPDGTALSPLVEEFLYTSTERWLTRVIVAAGSEFTYTDYTDFDDYGNPQKVIELVDDLGDGVSGNDILRETKYEYDRLDRLTQVTLPDPDDTLVGDQSIVRFEYTPTGRVQSEVQSYDGLTPGDPEEIVTRYVYDERHRLKHQIYNYNSSTIGVSPESVGVLGSDSADPNENVAISYQYDATGNMIAAADPLGRIVSYTYDLLNRAIRITEPDPDDSGLLVAPVSYLAYDAVGRLLAERDANGNVTRYAYDARHRVTDVYAPLGAHTQFSYDAAGQLRGVTDAEGSTTRYTYDDAGRLAELRLPGQDATPIRYQYDTLSNVRKVTDQLGRHQVYEYDDLSRLKRTITNYANFGATTDAPDQNIITAYTYLDDGMVDTITETIGWSGSAAVTRVTDYDYDGLGRLSTVNLPELSDAPKVHRRYDAFGNLQYDVDQLGNVTEYQYDKLHRLTKVIQEKPDGTNRWDDGDILGPGDVGFVIGDHPVTTYRYDAGSQLLDVTDPMGRVSSFEYDHLGRVTAAWSPDPTTGKGVHNAGLFTAAITPVSKYTYDAVGNVKRVRNAGNVGSNYDYDALHRLIEEESTDTPGHATKYTYDRTGNLLSLTDPVGNTTAWSYDELDRVVRETNELGHARTFEYDIASRLIEKVDRNGRKTEYHYDNMDRLTSEEWFVTASAPTPSNTIEFSYDHAGRLLSSDDAFHNYSYQYDARNRVSNRVVGIDGLQQDVWFDYQHDTADRLSWYSTMFVEGMSGEYDYSTVYSYDNLHRVTSIVQGAGGTRAVADKYIELNYDKAGQLESVARFNGYEYDGYDPLHNIYFYSGAVSSEVATTGYTYDDGGRLAEIKHWERDGDGTELLAGYSYTFDNQNRLRVLDFLPDDVPSPYNYASEDVEYNYDDRGQVVGADYNTATDETYEYDENGNRTNGSYDTGPDNRLLDDGTYTYTYDNEGNRLTRVLKTGTSDEYRTEYTWDHRNRLTKVTFKNNSNVTTKVVEHTYDAANQWISRTVDTDGDSDPDLKTIFIHDAGQIVMELENSVSSPTDELTKDDLTHRYLWGPAVDMLLADEQVEDLFDADENEVLWALTDHLGTVRDLVDHDGQVRMHRAFDAFGKIMFETHYDADGYQVDPEDSGYVTTDFGYTGKKLDTETGLQNNWNRWYDAAVGRWISEDPIGFAGGDDNLSRYVLNQPSSLVDPSGESPESMAIRRAVTRNAYRLFKKRLKDLTSSGMVQIHHVVLQKFFDDPKLGPFLKKIGVFKHDLCNTIPLPTVNGRILKEIGKRSLHQGYHLDEYVNSITKRLLEIEARHTAKELSDEAALALVRELQKEAKKGLRDGSIKLINEELAVEKALQASAVLAAIAALGNVDEFNGLMEEASSSIIAEVEELARSRHQFALACPQTFTGRDGVAGWLGWGLDLANPAGTVAALSELEYLMHVMDGGNPYGPTPSEEAREVNRKVWGPFSRPLP